ncbi:Bystin-domain-containing protein [Piromyces finnis]|uniref:Bystin-domain-containing protein n=1 Tax=Piromyces finnis TaxID=1754191 RepID=A0A1Y1VQ30_9FUNG|nr:Bystin-domain-containing protein [Piromyces finnis]|eukprot:ORX60981.1 Bystin-domain-containing protein [Piromyces finnis]
MGKVKKSSLGKTQRHDPLHLQIGKDTSVAYNAKNRREKKAQKKGAEEKQFIDPKTSKRILSLVREQQEEIAREENDIKFVKNEQQLANNWDISDNEEEQISDDELLEGEYEDYTADIELDEKDKLIMEQFMSSEPKKQQTLADIIMSKINSNGEQPENMEEIVPEGMDPKVVEVYSKIALLMSRYKSGSLPKVFKIIPSFQNWEEVLWITQPYNWTPNAVYQATRIFASNLKSDLAQRFYNLVLLDRIRDEIQHTKKLNYHLYMALKKALYKPGAFFKGILLPLCESGTCTLREAAIIGSVITKVSIPILHSSAALMKLADMDYTGPNSYFIRILLDKKYALPFKVIDSVVFHFLRFKRDPREMPVLWHQSLLIFAQRYKEDITPEQRESLLDLMKYKYHEQITPEIRRELSNVQTRDEMMVEESFMDF